MEKIYYDAHVLFQLQLITKERDIMKTIRALQKLQSPEEARAEVADNNAWFVAFAVTVSF
jgi:hypothetical protein